MTIYTKPKRINFLWIVSIEALAFLLVVAASISAEVTTRRPLKLVTRWFGRRSVHGGGPQCRTKHLLRCRIGREISQIRVSTLRPDSIERQMRKFRGAVMHIPDFTAPCAKTGTALTL
jgi:hypothetical protein